MKVLTFLAEHFRWAPFSQTLPEAANHHEPDGMDHAVVVFVHLEKHDFSEDRYDSVFRKALKHIKWLANKMEFQHVVLHSFTHLGGDNASPQDAEVWLHSMAQRLEQTGYRVKITPFGWFCSWELKVLGDSLAKVWKEF